MSNKGICLFKALVISSLFLSIQRVQASTDSFCSSKAQEIVSSDEARQFCFGAAAKTAGVVISAGKYFLEALRKKLDECQLNGLNCSNYKIRVVTNGKSEIITLDLTKIDEMERQIVEKAELAAKNNANACFDEFRSKGFQGCKDQFAMLQSEFNRAVDIATLYILRMMPGESGRIDVADLLAGRPLGGDGAFVVQFRETLLTSTGISGDVAKFIRDPIHVAGNVSVSIVKETRNVLNNICGDICKSLRIKF